MAAQPLIRRRRHPLPGGRSLALLLLAAAATPTGCSGPHPFIKGGDANSVDITYSGDIATALPLAKEHCARYERKPVLADTVLDVATFNCVSR